MPINYMQIVEPLLVTVVSLSTAGLSALGAIALKKLNDKLGMQNDTQLLNKYQDILDKSIHAGGMASLDFIKEKGWEHPEVRDRIVQSAVTYAGQHFADTIQSVGLDLTTKFGLQTLGSALERSFPIAIQDIAHSPVTPPAPLGTITEPVSPTTPITIVTAEAAEIQQPKTE